MPLLIGYSYNPKTGRVENDITKDLNVNQMKTNNNSTDYYQRVNEIVGSNVSDATKLDRLVEMGVPIYKATRLVENYNHTRRTNNQSPGAQDIAFLNKQNNNEVQ